ncbi:MAG TPA: hypothetical protein GXZ53_05390 [Firmicutes bacterium]|nr:hypothetical protein [Bacillota bacterium]
MKIGIPRAFLYYRYKELWETFFRELGIEFILSPETQNDLVRAGSMHAIDEACLSSKIYLGHVAWLLDKCDYLLIPRISRYGAGTVCSKYQAIYDVVANTFRKRRARLLCYNFEPRTADGEMAAFIRLGKALRRKNAESILAYLAAKQAQKKAQREELEQQERLLSRDGMKILVVAHRYNVCDKFIGEPILNRLREMGALPIIADIAPKKEAVARASSLSETLPWALSKELVGSVAIYRRHVDGIILLSAFPCGPDSLVNEMLTRKIKDKPVLTLIMDGHQGMAGIETRLESFLDIIRFQEARDYGCV